MASTRGGLISIWPCASEGSESTLREADVLATLAMYDPGMLASWYRRRYGSVRLQVGRPRSTSVCVTLGGIKTDGTLTYANMSAGDKQGKKRDMKQN